MRFMPKRNSNPFDDYIEIFSAGTHTDSSGATKTWTEEDLDEIVANHNPKTEAPIVLGHPETDDPAYGWSASLKRVGQTLFAKFKDVAPSFAKAVVQGHYRKRSVKIGLVNGGLRLLHVGWLGATPPALDLEPVKLSAYSTPDAIEQTFEFEREWYTPNVLARAMRRLREFFIEQFGLDAADKVVPSFEIDDLDEHAQGLRNSDPDRNSPSPAFSRPDPRNSNQGAVDMPFSQKDLDNAKAEGRREAEASFNADKQQLEQQRDAAVGAQHTAEFKAELTALQDEGKLTPAQAEGALEFMQSLAAEPKEFEFSSGDGKSTSKKERLAWFRAFLAQLPKQVNIGGRNDEESTTNPPRSFSAPSGTTVDSDRLELHQKALAYASQHNVPYDQAFSFF